MSPPGGIWAPIAVRVLRQAVASTTKMVRANLVAATRPWAAELQPVAIRASLAHCQPIHPAALLRQQKRIGSKWFSTRTASTAFQNVHASVRRYVSSTALRPSRGFDRSSLVASVTARSLAQLTRSRAPFGSTLRPNLTGGALPRTAGGYAIPGSGRAGGARYFSHTPTAPAQVMQNVSQAMRAFWTSGNRARFDGIGQDGKPKYRDVSAKQEDTRNKMSGMPRSQPGAFVDFRLSPTLTALSPLAATFPFASAASVESDGLKPAAPVATLGADGLLDGLSLDFARALQDLSAVSADLKRLASLGDLSIALEKNNVLRVRFPGVDADTVDFLCNDLDVTRGVVGQDKDFDVSVGAPIALQFPFAPDGPHAGGLAAKTITSPGGSMRSHNSDLSLENEGMLLDELDDNPWLSTSDPEGYESASLPVCSNPCSEGFEGLEGIYRFLEECDRAKGKL